MTSLSHLATDVQQDIIDFAKDRYSENPDVPELGDYIPFLAYFGETNWVDSQIDQARESLLEPAPPSKREDTLVGLLEYHRLRKNDAVLGLTERYLDYLFTTHVRDDRIVTPRIWGIQEKANFARYNHDQGTIRTAARIADPVLSIAKGWQVPPYVALARNGIFVELLVDTYAHTGNVNHLERAKRLADRWIQTEEFQTYGLFPTEPSIPGRKRYAQLFKGNTAVANGLIALVDETGEDRFKNALQQWVQSVHERCVDGPVYGIYEFETGRRSRPELFFAFSTIDALCYATVVTNDDRYLDVAVDIAEYWLPKQKDTGLFPLHPGADYSHQDAMTDFSISLWRLFELTGVKKYRRRSREAMRGLFNYHRFSLNANINTGEPVDETVTPRFVTLMAKTIILLQEGSIYDDWDIFKLLRDR